MIVGYIMQKYPLLTLTFVYREVSALRAAGVHVDTFSMWKPRPKELSAEAQPLIAETFYVFPLDVPRFIASHLRYLVTRPRCYLGTLIFCLQHDNQNWSRRLRALGHFLQAGYLAAEVERRGIYHLHAHFARGATTLAMLVSRLTGATFSFTAHANDIFVAPTMLPEKLHEARFAIAISEYNRQVLLRQLPCRDTEAKLHVVRCGVDVRRFSRQPRQIMARGQAPVILGVGRLVEKKGFRYLVAACEILARRGYVFTCEIVGEGPERAMLLQTIDARGLTDRVHLAGAVFQEHLAEHLAAATVFAMPCVRAGDGDMDGIPNTLMEAMAMEIPVVSTTITGIPELVEHERTGLLTPPEDAPALADALARLLDDAGLRMALGRAGRAKVMADFEIEANSQALLRVFKSELGQTSDQASAKTAAENKAVPEVAR
jgi:glycosyltransferase involved in cell wall biosynthesis